ncbi:MULTISPECIES: thiopurine S-methyltransferase [unclassified Pseudomonas]|uniref:thiopurine S-methyltransferase n=1 Tax=unclassified Pseudomonas TaxID=196821 RepID=UPI0025DD60BE|nr:MULTISPECIES: thiopurine S-methyltransferase [unclassified Pseudomonas]
MEPEFWHERWAINQIGFNQSEVNPYLVVQWPELKVQPGARVFVPLCGKTIDLHWLLRQGLQVVGVELSEKAVAAWFSESGLTPSIEERGSFQVYRHEACEIWCGDFFALKARDIGECSAFYDRAALIALPPEMRWQYVEQLNQLMAEDACGLLITLEYEQTEVAGPPFSVDEDEVHQLLSVQWRLRKAGEWDVLEQSAKFKKAGAVRLMEGAYRMFRR